MKINVDIDPESVFGRQLHDIETTQIPFAMSVAINRTSNLVRDAWKQQLQYNLQAPRPFTVNSPRVKPSSKKSLHAEVYIQDQAKGGRPPSQYLLEQVFGGQRRNKAIETAFSGGRGLQGLIAVPGKSAAIDKHGNQSTAQLRGILKELQSGERGNMFAIFNDRAGRQPGSLPPGIYRRVKRRGKGKPGKVKILVAFVRRGNYRARLDLFATAKTVVDRRFAGEFTNAFIDATNSAFRRSMGLSS